METLNNVIEKNALRCQADWKEYEISFIAQEMISQGQDPPSVVSLLR